ncbi:hypothetical protein A2U01_0053081, partial [Trifolium medium]|nr:hypothetical protein [Trifolium medium]
GGNEFWAWLGPIVEAEPQIWVGVAGRQLASLGESDDPRRAR